MDDFPPLPDVEDAPAVTDDGHLWLLERVDGYPLRFSVEDGGWLAFGGPDRVYRESSPPQYRPAIRHVRETIDRAVLGDVPENTVFYGVATSYHRIEYDWNRLPPFLGVDVRSGSELLGPDAAERAFDRLDLSPVNAVRKEVVARHFSPSAFDVPDSNWYDGPPLGMIIRNKGGGRASLPTPGFEPDPPEPLADDPAAVANRLTTPERIEAALADLEEGGRIIDFETVRNRTVERVLREGWGRIAAPDRPVDPDVIVSTIEAATREYLVAERPDLVGGA